MKSNDKILKNMADINQLPDDREIPKNLGITPAQQMISSCTGAILTSVFVTPLDVVKVRLQSQHKKFLKNRCFLYCNSFVEEMCCIFHAPGSSCVPPPYWYATSEKYFSGTFDAFIKIVRAEGVTSLWSGLPPTLVMSVPSTVVYFTLYDQLCYKLKSMCGAVNTPIWIPMVAGCTARTVAVTLTSPLELVRTKMQSERISYSELSNAIKILVQNKGVVSMYRGLGPTFLRDVPFSAIYWAFYELFKIKFHQETPAVWFSFIAGATAGSIAAVTTMPFDVIKTLRQIELGEVETLNEQSVTKTSTMLRDLYQRNGYRALFAGVVPRVIKIAPACAIMISSYEYGKTFFHKYNASRTQSSI